VLTGSALTHPWYWALIILRFRELKDQDMMSAKNESANDVLPPLPRGLNFLLVDDDDICLFIHRRVLELSGYCRSAHSAGNGRTALEILNHAAGGDAPLPDIILLDLEMPVMNGLAFLEAFRSLNFPDKERIAIVLLTSSVSEKDREYALALGAAHYLSKPFTMEAMHTVVRSLFNCNPHFPVMFPNK
jgi:CheY-like chemotaxis protein